MDKIFPLLFSMLLDSCDDVLLLDLQILCDICDKDNPELANFEAPYLNDLMKKQVTLVKIVTTTVMIFFLVYP